MGKYFTIRNGGKSVQNPGGEKNTLTGMIRGIRGQFALKQLIDRIIQGGILIIFPDFSEYTNPVVAD